MIIGITGPSGAGKTTLLNLIREKGGLILDCDKISHGLLSSDTDMLAALAGRFPGAFPGGRFDRKKLGAIVFSDPAALLDLNAITHAAVKREVLRQLEQKPALAAIDAIALFEGGLGQLCDITVAVTAPEEIRVRRLMARDGISEDYARKRVAAQHPESWFRERCDRVISNDAGSVSYTHLTLPTICSV